MSAFRPGKCSCCGLEKEETGVASSPFGPISHCYCIDCLKAGVSGPEIDFEYLYDYVSTDGEGLDPSIDYATTWKDGRVWTWVEWKAWRQHPDRRAKLDACRDEDLARLDAEEDASQN